jgi:hypothetical protein
MRGFEPSGEQASPCARPGSEGSAVTPGRCNREVAPQRQGNAEIGSVGRLFQSAMHWDAVHGASSYIVDCRENEAAQPWQQVKIVKQSRCTSTDHTPGKIYAFRVRALGPLGEGPWSDEAVRMSP